MDRSLDVQSTYTPTILISGTSWRGPQVASSGDAAALVPANRWEVDVGWFEHTTMNKRFGSFIDGAEKFDNVFFAISGQEAAAMDAQQRLTLEGSWEALRSSLRAGSLSEDASMAVAVTVGISYNEYYLNSVHQGMTAYTATSGTLSVVCGRISFTLGLKGPSLSIDTACSSSLVGAHLSATSFIPGGCPRALACGVNLTIRAETTAVLSKAGMLTADGRCKTLDASANGYMRGEACVVHLLEAADEEEERFGGKKPTREPLAMLAGTGVNQDGRASSLTAPNGPAQQAVIRAALSAAAGNVLPYQIAVLEMHGTGTALGDPIEVGAAFAVLQQGEGRPLELQAAKSRMLHTEPAAGALGLAMLVQRLNQTGVHETLHLRNINPHVASIFRSQQGKKDSRGWAVARQPTSQPHKGSTQRGSVSSFAYQGTNSHALVITSGVSIPIDVPTSHWQKSRMWFQITCHPMLMRFATINQREVRLEAPLGRAALHYLLDHGVLDRHIAPSSLLLEIATAAGHVLAGSPDQESQFSVAISKAAFSAPLPLGPATQAQHAACVVNPSTGAVALSTYGPGIQTQNHHMAASFEILAKEQPGNATASRKIVKPETKPSSSQVMASVTSSSVAPSSAFAMILAHQQSHTGYWLHPAVAESSQQLAMALVASPGLAMLAAAVELCSIATLALTSTLANTHSAGCSISTSNNISSWVNSTSGRAMMITSGSRFNSLASWAAMGPITTAPASSMHSTFPTALQPPLQASTGGGDVSSIITHLSEVVAQLLGENIAPDQPLMAAGLDSVGAVELKNAVGSAFGIELPSTVTFDYPSVQALAGFIAQNTTSTHQSSSSAAPTAETLEASRRTLLEIATGVLGAEVAPDQPLMEAGLDSIGAVELRNAVQDAFGVELPATVTYDYPTVDALAGFILTSTASSQRRLATQFASTVSTITSLKQFDRVQSGPPLSAVTGWAGVAASTSHHAGTTLAERFFSSADLIRPVPLGRWDLELVHVTADIQGAGSLRMAAWVDGVEAFDESIFRLSKSEAVGMDPQCRVLLEQTWEVLDDGGIMQSPALFPTTGVYVGIVWTEYQVLQESLGLPPTTAALTGSGLNFSVGRVSYTYGIQGPCVGMDTACSSSLVAIHMAHRGLHDGETSAAVASGSNFMLVASTSVHLAQLGSLSLNGRSKTFDASADGYGRGEACIAMVLQRAGDVVAAGGNLHALLHGKL